MADPGTGQGSGCHDFRRRGRSRRDALRAGALAMTGLGLPELFRNRAVAAGPGGFGRAKSCMLIFMWGGPSQLDTWDPKPDAPAEIRGSFEHDRDQDAGRPDQRALPDAGDPDGQAGDRPVDEPRRLRAPLDGAPGH